MNSRQASEKYCFSSRINTKYNHNKNTLKYFLSISRFSARFALAILLFSLFVTQVRAKSIAVLVNDQPISQFDIDRRIALHMTSSKEFRTRLMSAAKSKRTNERWRKYVTKHRPRSRDEAKALMKKFQLRLRRDIQNQVRPKLRKKALNELIDEKLKLTAAKKNNIEITDDMLEDRLATIAKRNKNKKTGKPLSVAQFKTLLKRSGIDVRQFKERMRVQIAWMQLINRKFAYQVSVSKRQIHNAMNKRPGSSRSANTNTGTRIIRVTFPYSRSASEKVKANQFIRANTFRKGQSGCDNIISQAKRSAGLTTKNVKNPKTLPSYVRGILNKLREGQLTSPLYIGTGIILYTRCAPQKSQPVRTASIPSQSGAGSDKRKQVENSLKQKEILRLGNRYLQDLRQDAYIEYK